MSNIPSKPALHVAGRRLRTFASGANRGEYGYDCDASAADLIEVASSANAYLTA